MIQIPQIISREQARHSEGDIRLTQINEIMCVLMTNTFLYVMLLFTVIGGTHFHFIMFHRLLFIIPKN